MDHLKHEHRNTDFEAHARVVMLHVEAACGHTSFHHHQLVCQVLEDHHVDMVKPPKGELDRPAVEPDHTHHILI